MARFDYHRVTMVPLVTCTSDFQLSFVLPSFRGRFWSSDRRCWRCNHLSRCERTGKCAAVSRQTPQVSHGPKFQYTQSLCAKQVVQHGDPINKSLSGSNQDCTNHQGSCPVPAGIHSLQPFLSTAGSFPPSWD